MVFIQAEHHRSLEREQQRANDAEQRLRMQAQVCFIMSFTPLIPT